MGKIKKLLLLKHDLKMGNQPSSSSSSSCIDIDHPRPFSRIVGSLGLNQNQLDKKTQDSGLYNDCEWDDKAIRRLIAEGRLAARMKGDEYCRIGTEECPICFLGYSEVNTTKCCNANLCTECYLQVRPQKEKLSTCPFCNCNNLSVVVARKKKGRSSSSISSSLSTTSLSASSSSINSSSSLASGSSKHKGSSLDVTSGRKKSAASVSPHSLSVMKKSTGFGSHLEQDERFKRTKKRSESFASNEGSSTPKTENEIIKSMAMTTEERKRLEDDMRAQHYHPLVLGLEAEAQERRLENDRAYRNSTDNTTNLNVGSGTRRMRPRGGESTRDWHQLSNFFERGDSIEDMVALEAAILFSMGEDRPTLSLSTNEEDSNNNSNNNNETARNSSHERFSLLRSLLTGQLDTNNSPRNLNSSRRGRSQPIRSSLGGVSATRSRGMGDLGSTTLDTAALMMRGISEDEQISMAIAASLQNQSDNKNNDASGEDQEVEEEHTNGTSSSKSIASNGSIKLQQKLVEASSSSSSSSSIPLIELKQQGIGSNGGGDEASTITELARVVTDNASTDEKDSSDGTVNKDTTLNGIAA